MELSIITEKALTIIKMVFSALIAGGIVFVGTSLIMRKKKYGQYKVIVFEKDGMGQWRFRYDNAGVFVDAKTNNKRFWLRKERANMNPDQVPFIQSNKGVRYVYIAKIAEKNYRYLAPMINSNNQKMEFSVGEEDVNWAINSYERAKKSFLTDKWREFMPYAALAFIGIIFLVVVIQILNKFEILSTVATTLKETASIMAQSNTGTVIIEGGVV